MTRSHFVGGERGAGAGGLDEEDAAGERESGVRAPQGMTMDLSNNFE